MNNKKSELFGQCLAEFIGTGLLVFFGVGCVAALVLSDAVYDQWDISLIWGLGVAIAIYCTAGVSGAHINPAVTISLACFHGFEKSKVLPYIAAQIAGAFCSAALVYGLYSTLFAEYEVTHQLLRGSREALTTAGIFSTYPQASLSLSGAVAVEFVITAVLMFAILAIGDDSNGVPRGALGPLFVGLVVAVIGGSMGPLTGFAMNPARDFGPKLFAYLAGWDYALSGAKNIPYFIVPIAAPVMGACFGGWLYPRVISLHLHKHKQSAQPPTVETKCDSPVR